MCEYDDHAAIAATAPAETLRAALVPPAIAAPSPTELAYALGPVSPDYS
ncbi:hypothetical protein Vau01_037290 [Virgisporangium aurantiacum]|uniref:Uncharacterized protein n=1 Tax=Virgisporangium aurantiacum TaxID=175570 RepID=A0A8J3Z7A8_9ACTN|nr:hypothetical protein Vau01_037290 [Virgisporangium aurantiacum]